MTLDHLHIDCYKYNAQRAKYKIPSSVQDALKPNSEAEVNIIKHLEEIDL